MSSKDRQYMYLAQQLQTLQENLQTSREELNTMSLQCNEHVVNQLGRIHTSWLKSTNQWLGNELSKKK
ncbi:DASH complex subunit Hsk3p [Monosporozyma unispora]